MDFRLYGQILWRHKLLVIGGLVLAILLAELSIVRVELERDDPIPSVRGLVEHDATRRQAGRALTRRHRVAKRSCLSKARPIVNGIALLYAQLATSDHVRRLMLKDGPIRGTITADPVVVNITQYLPLIDLTAIVEQPEGCGYARATRRDSSRNVRPGPAEHHSCIEALRHRAGASPVGTRPSFEGGRRPCRS